MKIRVYVQGGLDTEVHTLPTGADILDFIFEEYGAYLEYDILTGGN